MLNFFNLQPETFGIDISDSSIIIMKLKKKGSQLKVAAFNEARLKPGIIRSGRVKNQLGLIKTLQEAVNKVQGEKINKDYAVLGLSEEKSFFQILKMPIMKKEDLENAIRFEAENYIPIPLHKVYLSFQVISSPSPKQDFLEVLTTAVPKEIVDSYVVCFKKAGIKIKAIEVDSLAITRALMKEGDVSGPIFIIDLGRNRTGFIIFENNSLRLTSSIPICGQRFTEILSRALEIDIKKAEKIKNEYGLKNPEKVVLKAKKNSKSFKKEILCQERIFEALTPALTDFVEQTRNYLDFYSKEVKKIILCGEGANLKGFSNFLSLELKIPTESGNPWINISEEIQMPLEKSLKYVIAIGLALRGVKKVKS